MSTYGTKKSAITNVIKRMGREVEVAYHNKQINTDDYNKNIKFLNNLRNDLHTVVYLNKDNMIKADIEMIKYMFSNKIIYLLNDFNLNDNAKISTTVEQ